jgi:hypothetical protein
LIAPAEAGACVEGADPGLSESVRAGKAGFDPIFEAETESEVEVALFAAASWVAEQAARTNRRSEVARIGAWGIWEGFGSG